MPDITLPTPGPGGTPGPQYAEMINTAIDSVNDVIETGRLSETALTATIDVVTANKVTASEVATLVSGKANTADVYTKTQADSRYATPASVGDYIEANAPEIAQNAAVLAQSDVGLARVAQFAGASGLYGFPNAADPGAAVYRIAPATYAASSSLNGQDTLVTATPIVVRPTTGTAGVFSVTADGLSMQGTLGTSGLTTCGVGVAQTTGVSRVTITGLNAVGVAQGIGAYTASLFNANDFRMLRWALSGTSRVYVLQRGIGTTLADITFTNLAVSTVVGQMGDVVELIMDVATHTLSLMVNGNGAASAVLSSGDQTLFESNTNAGVYSTPGSGLTPKLGVWEWAPSLPVGDQKMVTVGTARTLPSDVKLSAAMRGEVFGRRFNIRDYGAKMDTIRLTDAVATAGVGTVSSASRPFTSADVGKTIYVLGAGPVIANANDGAWISTIQSVSAGVATLASVATTSISGATCAFGTPDDAAFAAAQTAASQVDGAAFGLTGGEVFIPSGRTMATVPLPVVSYVDWGGDGRERSWVHVVMDRPGNAAAAGVTDWLTCVGRSSANPLIGARFHDFGVEAEGMIHTEGYGSALKPLNIYHVQRCSIERMNVWNTPATAIPFDHSYDQCSIRANFIKFPGRLAPSGTGPGGSGIGAGTRAHGAAEPTVIEGNVIIGKWSATVAANGHNGIFTEGQTGADPDAGVPGYRIINNTVIGMYYGISDTGSTGTLIAGNMIAVCNRGISLRKTTLPDAYPGLSTIIANNTVVGCTGPGVNDGAGIAISTPTGVADKVRSYVHTLIHDNQIIDNKSWGISVSAGDFDITGLDIHDNQILRNGRSGMRLVSGSSSKINRPSIHHNLIVNNGRLAIAGDQAAVLIMSGTTIERGRIQDNDWWDDQATATQLAGIVQTGATLTSVRVDGNGDI